MRVIDGLLVLLSTMPDPPGVAVASSAPVAPVIVPPLQPLVSAVGQVPPLPVTVRDAFAPVLFSRIPPPEPLDEIRWNVSGVAPTFVPETVSARPAPVSIVFPLPLTTTVPPPVALKPAPLVVEITSGPPLKVIAGAVPVELNAAPAPVLSVLVAPEKA